MRKYTFFRTFVTAILALAILFPTSSAETDEEAWRRVRAKFRAKESPWFGYVLGADSPVRMQLRKDNIGKIQFEKLMKLFEFFSKLSDDRNLSECSEKCYDHLTTVSYLFAHLYFLQFNHRVAKRYEWNYSRIYSEKGINLGKFDRSFVQDARQTMKKSRAAILRAFKSSPQLKKLYQENLDWKRGPFEVKGWNSKEKSQTCTFDRASAATVNGSFYLAAEAVSHSYEDKFNQTQRICEFINRDLNSSLIMREPLYRNSLLNNTGGPYINGTTIVSFVSEDVWLRYEAYSHGYNDNAAVREAYHKNHQNVDLALGAVTPSNIAVLALPMVMNFIPIAVLEDLKTWTIVLYIVFTDIFSCIPFIIKGIELIIIAASNDKDYLVVDQEGSMELGFIEIFAASCEELKDLKYIGKLFIIIGVFVTIFGVGLELLALYLVKRRKMKRVTDVDGIFELSFYLEKSELGIWQNDINENIEETELVGKMRRYSEELSYSDEDPSVIGDNRWKARWIN